MHYNFLPDKEKKELRREYRIRVFIVSIFFVSLAVMVGIGALFPAYINAITDEKYHLNDVNSLRAKPDAITLTKNKNELSASSLLASSLNNYINQPNYTSHINDILTVKGNIKLTSFIFDNSSSTISITISGLAKTRNDLLDFRKRIIATIPGTIIDLPPSLLALASNVSFSIKVIEPIK